MVRQVLFLSNLWLILWSCSIASNQVQVSKVTIPDFRVMESDTSFVYNQGVLYYQQKPFSGWQYSVYSNGDMAKVIPFYDGREEGYVKNWYPNRMLAEQRFFIKGRKEGKHQAWWENGQPKFVYQFNNDEHEGVQRVWAANGVLVQQFNYLKGHEEGQQQMWFEDGSLRSNYVVKNGRRFGLPGVKSCVSAMKNNTYIKPANKSIL
jgi:antitoxin component YwqK of YwqJK toxin-antitoxin module